MGGFIRTTLFGSFLKIWSLSRHCHTTIYNEAVVIISSLVAIYFSETSNTGIYPVRVLNHEIWHTDIGEYGKWFFIRIRFQVMPLIYSINFDDYIHLLHNLSMLLTNIHCDPVPYYTMKRGYGMYTTSDFLCIWCSLRLTTNYCVVSDIFCVCSLLMEFPPT